MGEDRTYYTAEAYRVVSNEEDTPSYKAGYLHEFAFKSEEAIKLAASILNRLAEHPTRSVRIMMRTNHKVIVG